MLHAEMIDYMEQNLNRQEEPKVGIFWYDPKDDELIFVHTEDASVLAFDDRGQKTTRKMHVTTWQHLKNKEQSKGRKWKYTSDWTMTPRGRVWEIRGRGFVVTVGTWINDYPGAKNLILDEYNLPSNAEFLIDEHWDIGSGWSGDRIN